MHRVLAHELRPVTAPDDLWTRVAQASALPRPGALWARADAWTNLLRACATLACVALVLSAVWLRPSRQEIRSADPGEVQAWIRAKAGVDVPLRSHLPAKLRLTGARLVNGRTEIAYLVSGRVCQATRQHRPAKHAFALSCTNPDDLKVACALCHIG